MVAGCVVDSKASSKATSIAVFSLLAATDPPPSVTVAAVTSARTGFMAAARSGSGCWLRGSKRPASGLRGRTVSARPPPSTRLATSSAASLAWVDPDVVTVAAGLGERGGRGGGGGGGEEEVGGRGSGSDCDADAGGSGGVKFVGVGCASVACNVAAADAPSPADEDCKTWVEDTAAFSGCLVVLHMLQAVSTALSLI